MQACHEAIPAPVDRFRAVAKSASTPDSNIRRTLSPAEIFRARSEVSAVPPQRKMLRKPNRRVRRRRPRRQNFPYSIKERLFRTRIRLGTAAFDVRYILGRHFLQ